MTVTVLTAIIDTDTINTNHPPATPKCGLIPTRNCREESDTAQGGVVSRHAASHVAIPRPWNKLRPRRQPDISPARA
jgi:hypothetical protein